MNEMLGRVNHIALAVPDLDVAVARYRTSLGASVSEPQALPEHGVTVVFVQFANTKIELLEPLGETSPITSFLAKNPDGGMHHICYLPPAIISKRLVRACSARASRRSARMAIRCCSCIPRISSGL
jgi:methylmalonyl-CoA/ethylmalonyl-CoA epimerase